ncbi:hypothetical protein B0H14DRAFT_3536214 [Mycena olivaceomarginata]|nr:hypothetical protein B0H14DRAFT_3536214 [Mycena olivaceomarginata]
MTRAVHTNNNKSCSRPWSGFVASTVPCPPSMPAHDWLSTKIDTRIRGKLTATGTRIRDLSAEVSEAKAATEGDPTNAAKVLKYQRLVIWAVGARHPGIVQVIRDSCPFTNPGSLDVYYEAVAAFDHDFGHKYEATDEYEDHLSMKRKLRDIYKKILDLPEDRRARLVGQQAFSTSLQNPFLEHDPCRIAFDNKLQDHVVFYTHSSADSFAPTLHCTTIHLVFRNPCPYVSEYHLLPNKQKLVPVFPCPWHEMESLRTTDKLALPPTRPCACKTRTLDIAAVRMNAIEHIRIQICHCQTPGEQQLTAGLFPCSPHQPSLAVDVGVL